jgi:LuxR family maltose regulon positive regulatory protein
MTAPPDDEPAGLVAPELLATKLHAPRRRGGVVARPRLNERVAVGHRPVLTLVSAPAGFGKTTLLTEWFATDAPGASCAWLSLDAGDNDPAVFGAYLRAAVRPLVPRAAARPATSSTALSAIVTSLINELHAADRDIVLLLDDYHVVESLEIHDALTFLVDHAPPTFSVVLGCRADPPLPLARWRARGDLFEIRAADLRFTLDETTSYFSGALGFDLAPADVGALEARTEGWVAALQLAALSMHGREDVSSFIENFTGDDRFVVDYLVE